MTLSLKSRFDGPDGRRRLIDAIKSQRIVEYDEALATALVDAGELVEFETGIQIINQGDGDNDAYFIIDGEAGIFVNSRPVAKRTARDSIGEMALIDPAVRRSASVVALTILTALKISEPKFKAITEDNARVWRALSLIIADRLRDAIVNCVDTSEN